LQNLPAIIFDLDGTLADTAPDLLAALNHSLLDLGFPKFGLEEIGHLVGHGSIAMIRKAFELHNQELDETTLNRLHQLFLTYYEENIAGETVLYPGALQLLEDLQKARYPLFVCTNKYESMALRLLKELDILPMFKAVSGGNTFEYRKPDGRHLTSTLSLGKHDTSNAIMIGDTITDASAAKNAGLPCLLVDFGYSEIDVSTFSPNGILSHFDQGLTEIAKLTG